MRVSSGHQAMDELNLLRQHQHQHQHHLVVRGLGEEIDLEIGPGDDPSFPGAALVGVTPGAHDPADDHKSLLIPCSQPVAEGQPQPTPPQVEEHDGLLRLPGQTKKKKKVVKKWREEWADTYKWAYVAVHDNTSRIFCTVCKEYGRKHRRNPYGNEGSRNMQMSALEEHNNSLLHKEALRLQTASKENAQPPEIERPVYVKGWCCCLKPCDYAASSPVVFYKNRGCVPNPCLQLVLWWCLVVWQNVILLILTVKNVLGEIDNMTFDA